MKRKKEPLTTVEPGRCYYKFGDDFHHCLEKTNNVPDALIALADELIEGATNYKRIASVLKGIPNVNGCGQTHMVCITMPTSQAEILIKDGLVQTQNFGE